MNYGGFAAARRAHGAAMERCSLRGHAGQGMEQALPLLVAGPSVVASVQPGNPRRAMWTRLCCLVAVAACGSNPPSSPIPSGVAAAAPTGLTLDQIASGAVVLPNLGSHHRTVTTASADAQALFDQ